MAVIVGVRRGVPADVSTKTLIVLSISRCYRLDDCPFPIVGDVASINLPMRMFARRVGAWLDGCQIPIDQTEWEPGDYRLGWKSSIGFPDGSSTRI